MKTIFQRIKTDGSLRQAAPAIRPGEFGASSEGYGVCCTGRRAPDGRQNPLPTRGMTALSWGAGQPGNILRAGVFALLAAAMLSGCSKEPADVPGQTGERLAVSFAAPSYAEEPAAASDALPATRAALAENTTVRVVAFKHASNNPAQANFVQELTYYMSGGKLVPCTVNADGSFQAADNQNKMELSPDTYDFYAITPALPLGSDKTTVSVPNGADYAASVTAGVAVNASKIYTLTQLARQCSKVTFTVQRAADYTELTALSVTSGGGGVKMTNMPAAPQSVKIGTDIAAATGTAEYTVPAAAFTNTDATTASATTVLLPRPGTDPVTFTYDLTCTVSGTSRRVQALSGTVGNFLLEKGKSYTLTLTILKTGASLTVTDWANGGSWSTDMGGNNSSSLYPYVEKGKIIVSKNQYGSSGQTYHENWTSATMPAHNENDAANSVSARFEVANTDSGWITWTAAKTACAGYSQTGSSAGDWRMPTLKELQVISAKMSDLTGITALENNDYYWTGTNSNVSSSKAMAVNVTNGVLGSDGKNTSRSNVRCIRDL